MAILRNRCTCSIAVAAAMIVGGGYVRVWAASNLPNVGLKVFLVKRSTRPSGSHHNQQPNSKLLSDTRPIDVEGQAGDLAVSPHQEPRSVDIYRCTDDRCTPPVSRHSSLLKNSYARDPYHFNE